MNKFRKSPERSSGDHYWNWEKKRPEHDVLSFSNGEYSSEGDKSFGDNPDWASQKCRVLLILYDGPESFGGTTSASRVVRPPHLKSRQGLPSFPHPRTVDGSKTGVFISPIGSGFFSSECRVLYFFFPFVLVNLPTFNVSSVFSHRTVYHRFLPVSVSPMFLGVAVSEGISRS